MNLDTYTNEERLIIAQELEGTYGPFKLKENDVTWDDGKPTEDTVAGALLEGTKRLALKSVDAKAEATRLKFITPGSGQALVYGYKVMQAQRYFDQVKAGEDIDDKDYTLLMSEVGITAPDLEGVANRVKASQTNLELIASRIETIRLTTKKRITEAQDIEAIKSLVDSVSFDAL